MPITRDVAEDTSVEWVHCAVGYPEETHHNDFKMRNGITWTNDQLKTVRLITKTISGHTESNHIYSGIIILQSKHKKPFMLTILSLLKNLTECFESYRM